MYNDNNGENCITKLSTCVGINRYSAFRAQSEDP